jgi:hypothetical protein
MPKSLTLTCVRFSRKTTERGQRFFAESEGIYLDYSKNRTTEETLRLLMDLSNESGVAERREADKKYCQHRNRRVRSWPGYGL